MLGYRRAHHQLILPAKLWNPHEPRQPTLKGIPTMRLALPLLLLLLTVSCASVTSDIRADSRTYGNANLRAARTYQWDSAAVVLADRTGTWAGKGVDLADALRDAVNARMQQAGYTRVTSGADVSVSLAAVGTREEAEAVSKATGGSADPVLITEGCLIVDVFETGTDVLLWRGVARSTADTLYSREDVLVRLDFAVQAMFENFQR